MITNEASARKCVKGYLTESMFIPDVMILSYLVSIVSESALIREPSYSVRVGLTNGTELLLAVCIRTGTVFKVY